MRDLTEAEINDYLRFAKADTHPQDYHSEQALMVGMAARDAGLLGDGFHRKLLEAISLGVTPEELIASMWVWGFQMGRECESRLLTLALKGKGGGP